MKGGLLVGRGCSIYRGHPAGIRSLNLIMIKSLWDAFKIPLIIVAILGVLFGVTKVLIPFINNVRAGKTPVVSLEASNRKTYSKSSKIKASDFTVYAVHEDGKKHRLGSNEITISTETPDIVGKTTPLTITYKENEDVRLDTEVNNKREAVVKFNCGTPKLKKVKAVLYNNGELCFEGKGDVLNFNKYPWWDYKDDDTTITSVTFEEGVTPKSMDNWFAGMESIEYVDKIPSSVISMVGTFSSCSLQHGVDWSGCDNLMNVSEAYKDCVSLIDVPALLPSTVKADEMCSGCIALEKCPDMTNASSLESCDSMMLNCTGISDCNVGPAVVDMDNMFSGCINIESMPALPGTVTSMQGAFADNRSMSKLTGIPAKVEDISGCFGGCSMIKGDLVIEGEPQNYSGAFENAAVVTKVNLVGVYAVVNKIAYESKNKNILANGKAAANPESFTRK